MLKFICTRCAATWVDDHPPPAWTDEPACPACEGTVVVTLVREERPAAAAPPDTAQVAEPAR